MEEGGKDRERNGDIGTEVEEIEIDDDSKREREKESEGVMGNKRSTLPPSGLSAFQKRCVRADRRTFGQHDWLTEEIQLSTHRFALIDRSGLDLSEQSPVACACLCFIIYSVIRASWRVGLNKMIAPDWSLAVSECARAH